MFNGREVFKRRLSLLAAMTVASVSTALVAVPAASAQAYGLTGCKYASPKPLYIQRGQRVTDDYWSATTQASFRWNSSRLPTKFQPATGTRRAMSARSRQATGRTCQRALAAVRHAVAVCWS